MHPPSRPLSIALTTLSMFALACSSDDGSEDGAGGTSAAGAGGAAGAAGGGAGGSADEGPLAFTDELTAGTTIPPRYKCLQSLGGMGMGDNISPPLSWSGAPADARSLAVMLLDLRFNVFHWAIWDIPPSTVGLPEGIEAGYDVADPAGAHQVGLGGSSAYFGPCSDGGIGLYAFQLHALDVETLPVDQSTAPTDVQLAIEAASIEMITWEVSPE